MGLLTGLFGGIKTSSDAQTQIAVKYIDQLQSVYGIGINEHTALRISAVYSAINIISETIGRIPMEVRQMTGKGDTLRIDHPVNRLITQRPNSKQTATVWKQAVQGQVLLRGNGYTYIERNGTGSPVALHYLKSEEVNIVRINQDQRDEYIMYSVPKLGENVLPQDMIWIPAFAIDDYQGLSPIRYAAKMLEGAYSAMAYNADVYKKGGFFKGILTILGKIGVGDKTPAQRAKEVGAQFDDMYQDGSTPVIYDGSTYTPMNMNQRDLDFINYMRYSVEDIARVFNVPLSKLKNLDRAIQSNMESQQLEFATDTMQPWFEKWEQECTEKLLTQVERDNGIHISFQDKALLRGDTSARADYYNKLFYLSALSPNDIRRSEGLEDREGGDEYFSGVNLYTQKQVALQTEKMEKELEIIDKPIEPKTPAANAPIDNTNDNDNGN